MLKTVAHASLVPLRGLLTRRVVLPRIEFSRAFRPEPREQPEQHSAYASEPLDTIVNAGVFRRRPKRLIPRDRLARRPQREGKEPQPVRRRRSSISFRDVRGDRPDRPEKLLLRIRVGTGQSEKCSCRCRSFASSLLTRRASPDRPSRVARHQIAPHASLVTRSPLTRRPSLFADSSPVARPQSAQRLRVI